MCKFCNVLVECPRPEDVDFRNILLSERLRILQRHEYLMGSGSMALLSLFAFLHLLFLTLSLAFDSCYDIVVLGRLEATCNIRAIGNFYFFLDLF